MCAHIEECFLSISAHLVFRLVVCVSSNQVGGNLNLRFSLAQVRSSLKSRSKSQNLKMLHEQGTNKAQIENGVRHNMLLRVWGGSGLERPLLRCDGAPHHGFLLGVNRR